MIDLEILKNKCKVGLENNVQVEFSIEHLDVYVDGTGYHNKLEVHDNYIKDTRKYSLNHSTSIEDVLDKEEAIAKKVEQAQDLESTMEINGWKQVETSSDTFLKFVNATKDIGLHLNSSDEWSVNGRTKKDIKEAKYSLTKELLSRNPVEEIVNEVAKKELRRWLTNVDGVGKTISRKMASDAISHADGQMESLDDVKIRRPRNVDYSLTSDVRDYFDSLSHDPIKEAVREKKKELVQEHDQTHLVAEAL